jgi:4-hydroxybenzoate polyprenyltransferase
MKLFDYLFLHRPMLIIPVWTIALLGTRAALWPERSVNPFQLDRFPFADFTTGDIRLLVMLFLAALAAGAAFIINQIYDIESDRKNHKLFLLSEGHVSVKEAWALYFLSNAIAIAAGFVLNWQLAILFAGGALVGLQYSYPKFRVRSDSYKSFRNNMIAHGMLAFLFGWVMVKNFDIAGVLKSIPYMLGVGALYLNTTLLDTKGDKETNKVTYAIEWGKDKTQTIAAVLVASGLITAVMAADYAFAISAAVALPFLVAARAQNSLKLSTLSTKVAILALSLFAVLFFPIYLIFLIVTFASARLYYAKRFSLAYPVLWEHSK